jgi:hypothetical protein
VKNVLVFKGIKEGCASLAILSVDIDDILVEKKFQIRNRVETLPFTFEILMKKGASVWKFIVKLELIFTAKMLETSVT